MRAQDIETRDGKRMLKKKDNKDVQKIVPVRTEDKVTAEERVCPPRSRQELKAFVKERFGIAVPDARLCAHHASPMDYLWHSYWEKSLPEPRNTRTQEPSDAGLQGCSNAGDSGEESNSGMAIPGHAPTDTHGRDARVTGEEHGRDARVTGEEHGRDAHATREEHGRDGCVTSGDCLVWANRGGGKTQLAAMATLLEGIFKENCQTRIIAGSLDQAGRMYEYLSQFICQGFSDLLVGKLRKGACRFKNGTTVQVLPQSMPAVRGRHIHKLRCDEIEMFDEEVFNAAKYITHSRDGKIGAIEIFSTLHKPYGMMQKLVDWSYEKGTPVFRWCLWETIERCTEDRSCSRCALDAYCQGKARRAEGYLCIDDCITQMKRSSKRGFESEMLCLRPSNDNAVFTEFSPAEHVRPVRYDETLPLYRAVDFGIRHPFVCLWIQVDDDGTVRVIDEYSATQVTTYENARQIRQRTPGREWRVTATYGDPAGSARQQNDGKSAIDAMRSAGIVVQYTPSSIAEGIEHIRAALQAGDGVRRLVVHPKCKLLIKSLECYHFPAAGSKLSQDAPEKDGIHDHAIDALRYFFVNYKKNVKVESKTY